MTGKFSARLFALALVPALLTNGSVADVAGYHVTNDRFLSASLHDNSQALAEPGIAIRTPGDHRLAAVSRAVAQSDTDHLIEPSRYEEYSSILKTIKARTHWYSKTTVILQVKTTSGNIHTDQIIMPRYVLTKNFGFVARYLTRRIQLIAPILGAQEISIQTKGWFWPGRKNFNQSLVNEVTHTAHQWKKFKDFANFGHDVSFHSSPLTSEKSRVRATPSSESIDYNKGETLGIDVGGGSAKVVVLRDGIVNATIFPYDKSLPLEKAVPKAIQEAINTLSSEVSIMGKTIYIDIPGPTEQGNAISFANLPFEAVERLRQLQEFNQARGIHVLYENDGNTFTFFQAIFHQIKSGAFIGSTLGTGVGMGIIIDGELLKSSMEHHLALDYAGADRLMCGCGQQGCSETLANVAFINNQVERMAREKHIELPDGWAETEGHDRNKLILPWITGDETQRAIMHEAYKGIGRNLARAYAIVAELLDVHHLTVVWGGGIATQSPWIEEGLQLELRQYHPGLTIDVLPPVGEEVSASYSGPVEKTPTYFHGAAAAAWLGIKAQHESATPSSSPIRRAA